MERDILRKTDKMEEMGISFSEKSEFGLCKNLISDGKEQSRKRGFTLIEMVVTVGIILILTGMVTAGYGHFTEEIALRKANAQILGTVKRYRELSFYGNTQYTLNISIKDKRITVADRYGENIEKVELPKELEYMIPLVEFDPVNFPVKISPNGNMSRAFTLYTFGKSQVAKYRIGFYTFSQLKYLTVNLYRNISVKGAEYSSIREYHETYDSKNLIGWKKQ